MTLDELAARISEHNDEPDELLSWRQQAASGLDELAAQTAAQLAPRDGDRLDVAPAIRDRVQDQTAEGTTVQTLIDAFNDHPGLIEQLPGPKTLIQRYCQAFFTNGIHIHVTADEDTVLQPLHSRFADPWIDQIIVTADPGASATVVEGCSAPRSSGFRAGSTVIHAQDSAKVRYCNLQHWKQTNLLDSNRATGSGDVSIDHVIAADRHIVECDARSRVLTPGTAFQADGFIHDGTTPDHADRLDHDPAALTNLPDEYRKELRHILDLGD
ncbi:MAG: hypothetical protein SV186_00405 [Candidatus Nanohaloarchaea archaeon]|nr:hypothetical protein [Candidatus Nanohaloarchaea archaeon]